MSIESENVLDAFDVHTPGPWQTCSALDEGSDQIRICAGIELIAKVGSLDHPWEQTVADARLIKAAPKMLCTLRKILKWLDANNGETSTIRYVAAEAIKEATNQVV